MFQYDGKFWNLNHNQMKGFGFDITVVKIYCAYKKRNCAQNKFNWYEILAYTMYAFLFYCTYIIIYGFERKHILKKVHSLHISIAHVCLFQYVLCILLFHSEFIFLQSSNINFYQHRIWLRLNCWNLHILKSFFSMII